MILTDEEADECQRFMNSVTEIDSGSYFVRPDLADTMRRLFTLICLMGRADRFMILAGFLPLTMGVGSGDPSRPDYEENVARAIETAAKACAIYPLSISLYDFACILRGVGYYEEAKVTFAEFVRRYDAAPIKPHERSFFEGRDVCRALRDATNEISMDLPEDTDFDIPF
ncbi:MAG TPA: hypothetical protein VEH50_07155 [Methylomirabilota bacterium]|nr:hypothetical protein [Methylomirabilota bacterium]